MVCFDESPEVTEYDPVPIEDRSIIWNSRAEIKRFRNEFQQDTLMEVLGEKLVLRARRIITKKLQQLEENQGNNDFELKEKMDEIMSGGLDGCLRFLGAHNIDLVPGTILPYTGNSMDENREAPTTTSFDPEIKVRNLVRRKVILEQKQSFLDQGDLDSRVEAIMQMKRQRILEFLQQPLPKKRRSIRMSISNFASQSNGGESQLSQVSFLMERIREMVKDKLEREQFFGTEKELEEAIANIMKLPKDEIKEFLETLAKTSTPSMVKPEIKWANSTTYWIELPLEIRQAARVLGYTQVYWDTSWQPDESNKAWDKLTEQQQKAALKIGFSREQWDSQSYLEDSTEEKGKSALMETVGTSHVVHRPSGTNEIDNASMLSASTESETSEQRNQRWVSEEASDDSSVDDGTSISDGLDEDASLGTLSPGEEVANGVDYDNISIISVEMDDSLNGFADIETSLHVSSNFVIPDDKEASLLEKSMHACEEPQALPNFWSSAVDPTSGRRYYFNSLTQETTWEFAKAPKEENAINTFMGSVASISFDIDESNHDQLISINFDDDAKDNQESEKDDFVASFISKAALSDCDEEDFMLNFFSEGKLSTSYHSSDDSIKDISGVVKAGTTTQRVDLKSKLRESASDKRKEDFLVKFFSESKLNVMYVPIDDDTIDEEGEPKKHPRHSKRKRRRPRRSKCIIDASINIEHRMILSKDLSHEDIERLGGLHRKQSFEQCKSLLTISPKPPDRAVESRVQNAKLVLKSHEQDERRQRQVLDVEKLHHVISGDLDRRSSFPCLLDNPQSRHFARLKQTRRPTSFGVRNAMLLSARSRMKKALQDAERIKKSINGQGINK